MGPRCGVPFRNRSDHTGRGIGVIYGRPPDWDSDWSGGFQIGFQIRIPGSHLLATDDVACRRCTADSNNASVLSKIWVNGVRGRLPLQPPATLRPPSASHTPGQLGPWAPLATFSHFDTLPGSGVSGTHRHSYRQTDRYTTTAYTALA